MIKLKSAEEIKILRAGGLRLATILATLKKEVKPGVKTRDLDDLARELISTNGDKPAFLNYKPHGSRLAYPAALCVSVNEEIVHGIPSPRVLVEGDIVTLDLGLIHQGLFTDSAITVPVGKISKEATKLIDVTEKSLNKAIRAVKTGGFVGDIGATVEEYIRGEGLGLVQDLAGHGVGYSVHEDPLVPNYGRRGRGEVLKPGLVIAIEPMVTLGRDDTKILSDGFTFVTADGSLSAHFEHTIAVTENGVEVLTAL